MKAYVTLFFLLSTSGLAFASGPYTPPPGPHADSTKKKDDKKKDDKNDKNDKKKKDSQKDSHSS